MNNDPLLPYLTKTFPPAAEQHKNIKNILAVAAQLAGATSVKQVMAASKELQDILDGDLPFWRKQFNGDSGFSYLRGTALEATVMRLATVVAKAAKTNHSLAIVKLPTGTGVITGLSFQFSRKDIPADIPMILRRDRDDVIVGIKRNIIFKGSNGSAAVFENELIPICVVACKMYIDATRLENVLAKARNILASHSRCHFLVAADWDALGEKEWHDDKGRLLDSLYAPVEDIVFFRGDGVKRPTNKNLAKESAKFPYQPSQLERLAKAIESAISSWDV
jgi:hypothetical protein